MKNLITPEEKEIEDKASNETFNAPASAQGVREELFRRAKYAQEEPIFCSHYECRKLIGELSAALAASPGAVEALDSISTAEQMLSKHIEEFHDFDYQPHEVPLELSSLRNIQHHLAGSLIGSDGEPIRALIGQPSPGNAEAHARIIGALEDYREMQPEPDETWESWYFAAFDMAIEKITRLLAGSAAALTSTEGKSP